MNDRRSEAPGSDDDSYGNRSWEEFLRDVRREQSGTRDDEAESAPYDGEAQEASRDAPSEPVEEAREEAADDDDPPKEERRAGSGSGARPPGDARVVVPPETESEGVHRRRRRLLIGGASAVLLLVGAFLVYDQVAAGRGGGGAVTGQGSAAERAEPPGPGTGTDPVAAADRPDTAAPSELPRAPSGGGERTAPFAARADSLADAIASFRERRRDFDLGRIGCEGLARGLRDVQSAFAGLRAVADEDGAGLAPPARERFRRLLDGVRTVEDAFSESGCSGPP